MPRYRMMVRSQPAEGLEREYNEWYRMHLGDVLKVPGFESATRYRVAEHVSGEPPPPYLAIYEIEAESAAAAKEALIAASMSGEIRMADVMDRSKIVATIYELID